MVATSAGSRPTAAVAASMTGRDSATRAQPVRRVTGIQPSARLPVTASDATAQSGATDVPPHASGMTSSIVSENVHW